MSEVADDLGCDWHTVMDAVVVFGVPLIDEPARYTTVNAVGLDETLYVREGRYRRQRWSTQVVDVQRGQLLDVLDGKDVARGAIQQQVVGVLLTRSHCGQHEGGPIESIRRGARHFVIGQGAEELNKR